MYKEALIGEQETNALITWGRRGDGHAGKEGWGEITQTHL